MFNTPILFLVFNRLETTERVFERIKEIQPKYLFIAADGPRKNKLGEDIACKLTRELVLNGINWDCEVKTLFRDENLGCGKAVSEAITWFFNQVEMGIILEDDILVDKSFFPFCENLLDKYKHNEKIFAISGCNFQKRARSNGSYYFSAYGHVWGWASWRRAWEKYEFDLSKVEDKVIEKTIDGYFKTKAEKLYWIKILKQMKYNPIDTWDYQWNFTQWRNDAKNILPNVNLVLNIGFDQNATHTTSFVQGVSDKKIESIGQLIHPKKQSINRKADLYTFKHHNYKREKFYKRLFDQVLVLIYKVKLLIFGDRKIFKLKNAQ